LLFNFLKKLIAKKTNKKKSFISSKSCKSLIILNFAESSNYIKFKMSFRRSMKISSKKEPGFTINHICEIPEDNVNLNFYIGSEATLNLSSNWQPSMQKKNAVKQLCLNCQSLSLEAKSSVESSRPNIDKYFEKLKRSRSIKSGSDVGLNKTRLNFQHDIALDDLSVGNRQYLRNMIESMLFLAKQGIILAENESNQNHNLFFEFVKFKLNESSSQYCDMNLFNSKVQTDLYQILNDQVLQLIVKGIYEINFNYYIL